MLIPKKKTIISIVNQQKILNIGMNGKFFQKSITRPKLFNLPTKNSTTPNYY